MAFLNHLLWLKVRLAGRAWRTRGTAILATMAVLLGIVGSLGVSVAAALGILECGPVLGRVVAAGLLFTLYAGWLLGPAFGYRFNEGMNPVLLAHFPVSSSTLLMGLFLGNFLDPIVVVSLPFLFAVLTAGVILGSSAFWGVLGLGLFLFHAMGTAQIFYLWSLALLRRRRAQEILFVATGLLLLLGLGLFEFGMLGTGTGAVKGAVDIAGNWSWVEPWLLLTPPGICMEALMPTSPSSVYGQPYACFLLAAISGLSVWIAGRFSLAVISGGGGGTSSGEPTKEPWRDRLFLFFRFFIPSNVLAARAAAECRLVAREPQYLLLYIIYPFAYGVGCYWVGTLGGLERTYQEALVGALIFSSIFLFTGVIFNILAVERGGLRFAYTSPVDPLAYLVGKNLGTWAMLTIVHSLVVIVGHLSLGLDPPMMVAYSVAGQVSILTLLGLGNLASSLAPMPLPVHGTSPKQMATFGRIFATMTVNSLGMVAAGSVTSLCCTLLLTLPVIQGELVLFEAGVVLAVFAVGGIYTLSTLAGAWLLKWRRDALLDLLT